MRRCAFVLTNGAWLFSAQKSCICIVSRYGFEAAKDSCVGRPGLLRFIGENILTVLLVLATNPIAFRATVLRRDHARVVISRAKLLGLYRPN